MNIYSKIFKGKKITKIDKQLKKYNDVKCKLISLISNDFSKLYALKYDCQKSMYNISLSNSMNSLLFTLAVFSFGMISAILNKGNFDISFILSMSLYIIIGFAFLYELACLFIYSYHYSNKKAEYVYSVICDIEKELEQQLNHSNSINNEIIELNEIVNSEVACTDSQTEIIEELEKIIKQYREADSKLNEIGNYIKNLK